MMASTCMVAAQLWQWRRLEGRTQRRGSWRVSLSSCPHISVCKSSEFNTLLDWLFECHLGDDNRAFMYMSKWNTLYFTFLARGKMNPSFSVWQLCEDGWLTLTRFWLFPPSAQRKRFRFQLTIQSAPTEWLVWQQSVGVADLLWLIIHISVGQDSKIHNISIATKRCCNP